MPSKPWSKLSFSDTEPVTQPMASDVDFDAPTEPMPLESMPPEPRVQAPQGVSLAEVMAETRRDNRVCPLPTPWLAYYRLLETHARAGETLPPAPLTGASWAATPSFAKRMCFRDQVEWAASHDLLNATWNYLRALPEEEWHRG